MHLLFFDVDIRFLIFEFRILVKSWEGLLWFVVRLACHSVVGVTKARRGDPHVTVDETNRWAFLSTFSPFVVTMSPVDIISREIVCLSFNDNNQEVQSYKGTSPDRKRESNR